MRATEGFIENQLGFKVVPDKEAAHAPVKEEAPSTTFYYVTWTQDMDMLLWSSLLDDLNNIDDIE